LAFGWTRLSFFKSLIAVILLVPLIIYLTTRYGATGAAIAWFVLNMGMFFFEIPIMHRRLLRKEKWRWYREDIGIPLVVSFAVAGAFRLTVPVSDQQLFRVVYLALVSGLTLGITAMATSVTRCWLHNKISAGMVFFATKS